MTYTVALTADRRYFVAHQDAHAGAVFDFSVEDLPAIAQPGSMIVEGVALILATGSIPAARRVLLLHRGVGVEVRRSVARLSQGANLTERYCFGAQPPGSAVADGAHQDPLPPMVCPDSTWYLRGSVLNVQATDVISKFTVWGRIVYLSDWLAGPQAGL